MDVLSIVSAISLLLAVIAAVMIIVNLGNYPPKMKIMNLVWPLTALWAGLLAVWAFFSFKKSAGQADMHMKMDMNKHMDMKMDMPMDMKMDMSGNQTPFWQKITLSTFHCGAGCTVADIIGETGGAALLTSAGLYSMGGMWILDYILALIIGAFFQYAAIRPMSRKQPAGKVFWRALRIDFLSLTSWQIGMYALSYIIFVLVLPVAVSRTSWTFWFVMQLAMVAGFLCAFPMNWWLVKKGIKPAM